VNGVEYEAALCRLDEIFDAKPGTPENEELARLIEAVHEYESVVFLNDFHRDHFKRARATLARQPKATVEEALEQYDRIKRQSSRRKGGSASL